MLTPAFSASVDRLMKGKTAVSQSAESRRGSHEYGAAAGCKRLWSLRYHAGLRMVDDRPWRKRGTLFHTFAAYHYASQLAKPPDWMIETPREAALDRDGQGSPDLIRQAEACFAAYRRWYSSDPLVPVLVEEEFGCTIREIAPPSLLADPLITAHGDEPITCRTDLVAEMNGELWAVDHKTTGQGTNGRLGKWNDAGEYRLSLQVMTNLQVIRVALRAAGVGQPLRGFIVNRVLFKAPYEFDRNPVRVSPLAYEEIALSLADAADARSRALDRMSRGLPVPPNFSACYGRYGACDMADVCAASTPAAREQLIAMLF